MGRFTTPFLPPPSALIPSYFRGVQDGKEGEGYIFYFSPRKSRDSGPRFAGGGEEKGERKVREKIGGQIRERGVCRVKR